MNTKNTLKYNILFALGIYFVLAMLDAYTTIIGLSLGYEEINIIMRFLIQNMGLHNLYLIQLCGFAFLSLCYYNSYKLYVKYEKKKHYYLVLILIYFINVIKYVIVIRNFILLGRY